MASGHTSIPKSVEEVHFDILGPDEIKNMSCVEVKTADLYDSSGNPEKNSLIDPRMGCIRIPGISGKVSKCQTCGEGANLCPGHPGHMVLKLPLYNPEYVRNIYKLLKCICFNCATILARETVKKKISSVVKGEARFNCAYGVCEKVKKCYPSDGSQGVGLNVVDGIVMVDGINSRGCGSPVAQYKVNENNPKNYIEVKYDGEEKYTKLSAGNALKLLERVRDEDYELLGFDAARSNPKWMVMTVFPIPPLAMRPYILDPSLRQASSRFRQHCHTQRLRLLARANFKVDDAVNIPEHVAHEIEGNLQEIVHHYYYAGTTKDTTRLQRRKRANGEGNAPREGGIKLNLIGKEGRIRGNLQGKRVDESARSVITPDPNVGIEEVGVPLKIAQTNTYPERVTGLNIERLRTMVKNSEERRVEYPVARYITKSNGDRLDVFGYRGRISLDIGDTVHRNIVDGDYVLCNRQPSLHKMSALAHKAKILPGSSIRLNPNVTTGYNADFDGDEMNLHIPQSEESKAELTTLARVGDNVLSPQNGHPVNSGVQDTVLGAYKLSSKDCFLDKPTFMQILASKDGFIPVIPPPCILKPKMMWSGSQVISTCLPPAMDLHPHGFLAASHTTAGRGNGHSHLPDQDTLIISGGELLNGTLTKGHISSKSSGISHRILKDHGREAYIRFIDELQVTSARYLMDTGFSVGISDCIIPDDLRREIDSIVDCNIKEVDELLQNPEKHKISGIKLKKSKVVRMAHQKLESTRKVIANTAIQKYRSFRNSHRTVENRLLEMIESGSKGKLENFPQITAVLGQQSVGGERIAREFDSRILPHFLKNDCSVSGGYVRNGYLRGVTAHEFWVHAKAGREGVVNTSLQTPTTGYFYRQLVKALEDAKISYDGTVRDVNRMIIQFSYGEDGADVSKTELNYMPELTASLEKFREICIYSGEELKSEGDNLLQEHLDALKEEEEDLLECRRYMMDFPAYGVNISSNVDRIIGAAVKKNGMRSVRHEAVAKRNTEGDIVCEKPSERDIAARSKNQFVIRKHGEPMRLADCIKHRSMLVQFLSQKNERGDESYSKAFERVLKIKLSVKRMVKDYMLNVEEDLKDILDSLKESNEKSMAQPGDMVGVIAAQSIGQPATQMVLNTFHHTGIASGNIAPTLPTLLEYMYCGKKSKLCSTLYDDTNATKEEMIAKAKKMVYSPLSDVCRKGSEVEIVYDPKMYRADTNTTVSSDKDLVAAFAELKKLEGGGQIDDQEDTEEESSFIMRFSISEDAMVDKGYTMAYVADVLKCYMEDSHGMKFSECMWSDDNCENKVIRMRPVGPNFDESLNYMMPHETAYDRMIACNTYAETEYYRKVVTEAMSKCRLGGVRDVTEALVEEIRDTKKYCMKAFGGTIQDIQKIRGYDHTKTYHTKVKKVADRLGIEAARECLKNQIRDTLESQDQMDPRHLELIADYMTFRGDVIGVNFYGTKKMGKSALSLASVERAMNTFRQSSLFASSDRCDGVSDAIYLGKMAQCGTGVLSLLSKPVDWFESQEDFNDLPRPPDSSFEYAEVNRKEEQIMIDSMSPSMAYGNKRSEFPASHFMMNRRSEGNQTPITTPFSEDPQQNDEPLFGYTLSVPKPGKIKVDRRVSFSPQRDHKGAKKQSKSKATTDLHEPYSPTNPGMFDTKAQMGTKLASDIFGNSLGYGSFMGGGSIRNMLANTGRGLFAKMLYDTEQSSTFSPQRECE